MVPPQLRKARAEDVAAIRDLIVSASLPPMEIEEWLDGFFVLDQSDRILGCVGIECYGEAVLLRSAVVDASLRGTGEGRRLINRGLEYARTKGGMRCYLFTLQAEGFFARYGFERCSLDDFETDARESWQWRGISETPELRDTLIPMRMDLAEG